MDKKELAESYFLKGYSCSQAIILSFKDYVKNIDEKTLLKISSPLGGGLGRLRQTCGAFSTACLVLGYLYGNDSNDIKKKEEIYKRVHELAESFKKEFGTISCKEILNFKDDKTSYVPDKRTTEYYKTRPCKYVIGYTAKILEEYIKSHR